MKYTAADIDRYIDLYLNSFEKVLYEEDSQFMDSWAALNPRNFIMKRKLVRIPNGLMPGFLLMRRLPEPRPTSEPDFRK